MLQVGLKVIYVHERLRVPVLSMGSPRIAIACSLLVFGRIKVLELI